MANQEVVKLESYKKTAPQSRAEIVRLGKMLPESEGIPGLIIELTKTAEASGVSITSIARGTTSAGVPFGIQTVTIQVSGRYFDVEDFLYRLESYVAFRNSGFRSTGRLIDVATLSITGDTAGMTTRTSPVLKVTVTLNAYLSYETGRYRVSVNGYNLADRLNYTQVFSNRAVPAAGRTLILSVGARF